LPSITSTAPIGIPPSASPDLVPCMAARMNSSIAVSPVFLAGTV
jgi:hypothetical protein